MQPESGAEMHGQSRFDCEIGSLLFTEPEGVTLLNQKRHLRPATIDLQTQSICSGKANIVLPACETEVVVERRQSLRWGGSLACRFTFSRGSSTGRVENLSVEGARIKDPQEMPPEGSEIVLTLRPEQEKITLMAMVIYVKDTYFGVKFCGSRAENVEILKPFFHL